MRDLKECRVDIDRIDEQISKLYEERMKICGEIADYKIANNLKIRDEKREEEIIGNVCSIASDSYNKDALIRIFKLIMSTSRELQARKIIEGDL